LLATATVVLAITGLTDSSIYLPLLGLELIGVALGLVILFLGQVGEYLWRIHDELVDRPTYLVDNVVESNSNWSGGVSDDRLS
jgi:dolichol-phosphate mannosyltransferase